MQLTQLTITDILLTSQYIQLSNSDNSRSRSERTNRRRRKAVTINFEIFEKISIHSSIDLICLFLNRIKFSNKMQISVIVY